MRKKTVILAAALFMTGTVSAVTLGTFQYQKEKATDGEPIEFAVGLVNLGDTKLKVNFAASNQKKINLDLENSIIIPPSKVSNDPEGENWYALENGSYIKITEYDFKAKARNIRNRSFKLDIRARSNQTGQGSYKKIIQERTYEFTIVNRSYSEGLIDFEKTETEKNNSTGRGKNLTIASGEDNSTETVEEEKASEFGPMTAVLAAGVLVSGAYLMKLVVIG